MAFALSAEQHWLSSEGEALSQWTTSHSIYSTDGPDSLCSKHIGCILPFAIVQARRTPTTHQLPSALSGHAQRECTPAGLGRKCSPLPPRYIVSLNALATYTAI